MVERLSDKLKEYLLERQGRVVNLKDIRVDLRIDPDEPAWDGIRSHMSNMVKQKIVRPSGRNDGIFKVVTQIKPVRVFIEARQRKPPFDLYFPKDFDTGVEMDFAENIVIREGDIVSIGGVSNYGKTAMALNFCGENIDYLPVLMGNEYTTRVGETDEYEPTPRFLNRLDAMTWVEWVNGSGEDKFTLLPVREDYAEHIIKNKINIIDWINLEGGRLYEISKLMDDIKAELGRGIGILVLQKEQDASAPRGRSFAKDFTDCELLIDKLSERESMITIGKVKEYNNPVMGRTFAFSISQGVKIIKFREIVKCPQCWGKGWLRAGQTNKPCDSCNKIGFVDKE